MSGQTTQRDDRKYYSANGEDFLLWQFFDFRRHGLYLDIGAFDGIHFSNTYSFEVQGWKGICVEPNPFFFSHLVRNRPGSTCLQAACVSDNKQDKVTMFCEELGLLSTTRKWPDYERLVAERYRKRGLSFSGFQEVVVPAVTVDEVIGRLFSDSAHIDIVSIDVEGAEMDVLKGFDVRRHQPGIMVMESNYAALTQDMIEHLQSLHGYIYAGSLVENHFFVKTKAEAEKIRSIRIDCRIEPQMHPLGTRFTTEPYRKGRTIGRKTIHRLRWQLPEKAR